jgi:CheY-like chemotaxis protein
VSPVTPIRGRIDGHDARASAHAASVGSEARDRHVLVVEDDPSSAELLSVQLEMLGYSVDCAFDGNRAVSMACSGDYATMILDLNLPEFDGVEVLRILRARKLKRPPKVIVVSGDVQRTRVQELNVEHIDAYLTKPVDLDALGRELARLVPAQAA